MGKIKSILSITTFLLIGSSTILGQQEDPAVTRFREYLRINSAHPIPDYDSCIAWLRNQALEIGLSFNVEYYDPPEHSFSVWMTWNGTNPQLKSILIDSHMDVVAVDESQWDHAPFEAFKDAEGNIFARGAVDMKSTTVAVLESVRRLKASGFNPLRTIHIMILPDEELYSRGVKGFVNSTTFTAMNIGFALDEAVSNPADEDNLLVTYTEKSVWQFNYTVYGTSMHASTLPEITAGQKLQVVIDRLLEFRASQLDLLQQPGVTLQNLTTLNLVQVGGGLGNNIIPPELWVSFDMRIVIKPGWNFSDIENMLDNIAAESGNDTVITYLVKTMDYGLTPTDNSNIWWVTLENTCAQLNVNCTPNIPNGVTDGRYIRNMGIPVFGLNTFTRTPSMAHQTNERINENVLLTGITRFTRFIQNFAMVSEILHP
ncbi:aminoacylase-1 [Folsomia candida]|uniref:N-acyl-aliphatic-L-amino acid amidohydrolase n=1 Tax=Folsomia candida TaxID=158441 RepID=A0A226EIL4_FOLCA|nr:aminoacylase-1 [Folsomia candida]OXA57515.1 Aminoacylase-1 [Folsomia candida]